MCTLHLELVKHITRTLTAALFFKQRFSCSANAHLKKKCQSVDGNTLDFSDEKKCGHRRQKKSALKGILESLKYSSIFLSVQWLEEVYNLTKCQSLVSEKVSQPREAPSPVTVVVFYTGLALLGTTYIPLSLTTLLFIMDTRA